MLLGNLFYGRKELRQAQACYQNLVRINPQNLRYLRLLAQTSQQLRDYNTALQAWGKAAALVPEDETIRGIVGKLEKLVTVQPTDD